MSNQQGEENGHGQIEIDHALAVVKAAGYQVGRQVLKVRAEDVKVGDLLLCETGKYRIADIHRWVKIIGEGTSSWLRSVNDMVEVERG